MNYTSGYQEVGLGNSSSGIMYAKMTCAKVCGKMCLKYLRRSKDSMFHSRQPDHCLINLFFCELFCGIR